ncbi:cytochrome P450 714C2-like isoform X2 [Nicotiana tomentosiformis]|nr:cytochrome P450 714C2-like isoform X3 [Nicotiana tomentosiformis]XP_018624614.1 cytochrome P450 714C2-like isoform X3 [Nicotiana tomentosiformis]XP_018624615.1 cytochrome P450 714C2-like isoform X3 [Nicotiana tomentosiformis]XP_033510655.1 cytochrome P450 714C2-like isoform X3 [Nicotiana tomentosiformis]
MISIGSTQILGVAKPEMVREIMNTSANFDKPPYYMELLKPLFGDGVITSSGAKWNSQRKILAPEFRLEKLKGMIKLIQEAAVTVVEQWNAEIEKAAQGGIAEIHIDEHMRRFSAEVISRTCFGSSYIEGEEIFSKLTTLWLTVSKNLEFYAIPGMRHIPTKRNREIKALEKEIQTSILKVIEERKQAGIEKNLLQTILEAAKSSGLSQDSANKFIVDNCKNIYLAGYETTAVSAQWCLVLLSVYPEWQNRVRSEVIEVCKGQLPDHDMIFRMKQLTKVINETLRLYTPVPVLPREAFADMKFGDICIPKGLNIWLLATTLHTDPKVWGPNANEFNPDRFENGVAGACTHPYLYMPFGSGVRICVGQNFALLELKILISLLLSHFSFSLSPKYVHSPTYRVVIEPQHGVHLLVKKL